MGAEVDDLTEGSRAPWKGTGSVPEASRGSDEVASARTCCAGSSQEVCVCAPFFSYRNSGFPVLLFIAASVLSMSAV